MNNKLITAFCCLTITCFLTIFFNENVYQSINPFKFGLTDLWDSTFLPNSTFNVSAVFTQADVTPTLLQCMAKNWAPRKNTHPKAPINMMPTSSNLLFPISFSATFCKPLKKNLRVIFALSRLSSIENRQVIRKTYAAFDKYQQSSILGNWTLFFVLSRPENQTEQTLVENESREFGDVIVANLTDDYYQITFKTLIGLKVASCFCPHADYVIKADDDTYIRIKQLDYLIVTQQKLVDSGKKKDAYYATENPTQNGHQRFYTGVPG